MRFLAFDITLLPSSLVLLQRGLVMVLTSTLGHLRKVNDIARYIVLAFGLKKPMTSRKLIHLEEVVSELSGKREEGHYHAPETPDIDSGAPPEAEDNFRCA